MGRKTLLCWQGVSAIRRTLVTSAIQVSLIYSCVLSCGGQERNDNGMSDASAGDRLVLDLDVASLSDRLSDGGPAILESGTDLLDEGQTGMDASDEVDAANVCPNGIASGDAAACEITPSNYDTSCMSDTDCVTVVAGNFCGKRCLCGGGPYMAVNQSEWSHVGKDIFCTVVGREPPCPCAQLPPAPVSKCQNGQCVIP
jgi:hypothetical protein